MSKSSIRSSRTKRFASPHDEEAPGIDFLFSIKGHSLHRLIPVLKYAATIAVTIYLTVRSMM